MIRQRVQIVTILATTILATTIMAAFTMTPVFAENIKTEVVTSAVFDRHVNLGGTVVPFKEVTITAQQAGQVNYIAGIEGDSFTTGSLILSIDDDILMAQRNAAMFHWQQASYAHQNAVTQYNRELWSPRTEQVMPGMALPGLMDQMFTTPFANTMGHGDRDVEIRADQLDALANVNQALARMHQIKFQISEIDVRLSDTNSVAPFEGIIIAKMVEVGDTVQPGQVLLVFAKSKHLSIEVNVPINLMQGIQKGAVFNALLPNNRFVQVRVAQVFPVADSLQHTVKVKFDLPTDAPAAPGMYAEVSIKNISSKNQAFPTIPKTAIVKRGSLPTAFILNPQTNKIEMRIIRTGSSQNNTHYTVLSGITAAEQIIVNPPADIISGWVLHNGKLSPPNTSDEEI